MLELHPEHQQRYEEVRAWRESYPNPHFLDLPEDHPLRVDSGKWSVKSEPSTQSELLTPAVKRRG